MLTTLAMRTGPASGKLQLAHGLLLLVIPVAPPVLAGVLRAALGLGLGAAQLAAAVGVAAALAFFLVRHRPGPPAADAPWGAAVFLGAGCLLAWAGLYDRWWQGLVSLGGGDVGGHALFLSDFAADSPGAYHGFVTFYAVADAAGRLLGRDVFAAFRAGFFATVFGSLACIAAAVALVGRSWSRASWAALAALGMVVLNLLFFPLLHYHQADGFYPHLFGVLPLLATWVLSGASQRPAARVAILLGWTVVTRFTYGLNLGDALLAAAALLALEARSLPTRPRRVALVAVAASLLPAAVLTYARLEPLAGEAGAFRVPLLPLTLLGEGRLAWLLARLPATARRAGIDLPAEAARLVRLPVAFAAVNLAVHVLVAASGEPLRYYFFKYHFHAVALLVAASLALAPAVAGPALTGRGLPTGGRRVLARWSLAALIGLILVGGANGRYLSSYRELVFGHPPWRRFKPLADRDGLARIQAALRAEGMTFGGLLSAGWPLMHFMNGALGYRPLATTRWWRQVVPAARDIPAPGTCAFWYSGPDEMAAARSRVTDGDVGLAGLLADLDGRPGARCEEHPAQWDPAVVLRLCWLCRGPAPAGPPPPPR